MNETLVKKSNLVKMATSTNFNQPVFFIPQFGLNKFINLLHGLIKSSELLKVTDKIFTLGCFW